MKKYYFILLVLLGMFFMPNEAFACGSGKKSCEKEISKVKTEKKSCCDNDDSSNEEGCGGKCGHSKCGCSSTCPTPSVTFLSEVNFKNIFFNYSFVEKVKFSYSISSISDGFYSIWLIPKIS